MAMNPVFYQTKIRSHTGLLISALALLLLGGCATAPSQLQVPSGAPGVQQVRANVEANLNKSVRWGGTVAGVQNLDGQTRIEVIAKPLLRNGQPDNRQASQGRFVAVFDGFLEPSDFQANKSVTIVGVVTGSELGKVGEAEYDFPRLKATGHQLWSAENTRFARRSEVGYGYYGSPYIAFSSHRRGFGHGFGRGFGRYGRGYGYGLGGRYSRHSAFYDWWVPSLFFSYGHRRGSSLHVHIGN